MYKNSCLKVYENRNEVIYLRAKYGKILKNNVLVQLLKNNLRSVVRRYILLHERYIRYSKKRFMILYGKCLGNKIYRKGTRLRRARSHFCIEYWQRRGYTEEEANKIISKRQNKTSLKSFITRYGRDFGELEYKKYLNKRKQTVQEWTDEFRNSVKKKISNSWKKKSIRELNLIGKKCSNTLENFQKRHGKKGGLLLWRQYIEKLKDTTRTGTKYWLSLGYDLETAKDKVSQHQSTFSLQKCIAKFGEAEGTKRWKDRQKKWRKSFNKNDLKQINEKRSANSGPGYYSEKLFKTYPSYKNVLGFIYIMEFFKPEHCIKVGITKRNPIKRFHKRGVVYNLLWTRPLRIYDAFLLEQKVCSLYDTQRIKNSLISKREAFKYESKDSILEFLQEHTK